MTFEQYQKQSERCSSHSVIVTDDDCYTFFSVPLIFPDEKRIKQEAKGVHIKTFNYSYIADSKGNMWTMDDDGNPKRRSVFKYKPKSDFKSEEK